MIDQKLMNQELIQKRIHNLRCSDYPKERIKALEQLRSNFSLLPDKEKAGNDLHKLAKDDNSDVRRFATLILSELFHCIPDKQTAWKDLHNRTRDVDNDVKWMATFAVGLVFSKVPDQQQAWNDLHRLTYDNNNDIRGMAAKSLRFIFPHVSDKESVWNDLHRLTYDEDDTVRGVAAKSLQFAFPYVSDKESVWNDLHRLTYDEYRSVRLGTAITLGSSYSQIPSKEMALKDLHRLTNDEDWVIRSEAYHSLGEVSIFKASQVRREEDYKKELEEAIEFFEKASHESVSSSPSRFCLPFYRSFYTILFNKQEAEEEINKYLAEAKDTVKGSKSKKLLLEAVENLANALKEVQNLENLNLEAKKGELNFYRQYFDRAAELMIETEEMAPFATIAMRKGLPILDRNLKGLLEEIQTKAKIACKESKGTAIEEIACAINREIQTWEVGSQEEMAFNVENLIFTLESNVPRVPENQSIFNRIQQIREQKYVPKQYGIISTIIPLIPKIYMEQKMDELENDIKEIKEKMDYVIISLKPGIKEEIEISVGTEILGTGVMHKITIPLQEISYSELKEDLEKVMGTKIDKLSNVPKRLANKIKGYLLLHDKEEVLEKLI